MTEKKTMWNGGETNKYNEMLRESEDYYDTIDSEIEFREDLKERQKIMDKTRIKRPMHELYNDIDYEEKTPVSGMGGVQRKKIMLIERYCEKRLGTRAITARTIVRERKLKKLSKLSKSKRIEK